VRLEESQDLVEAVELDRLAHEVGGAKPQTLACLGFVDHAGDRDDRDAERPDRAELEEVDPAHPRELDVEEDRVGALGLERGERRLGRVDDDGLVTELEEEIAEDLAEVDLVLDNQHPHRWHRSTIGWRAHDAPDAHEPAGARAILSARVEREGGASCRAFCPCSSSPR
jgi:hypothetical protein